MPSTSCAARSDSRVLSPPDRLPRLITASLGIIAAVTGRRREGRSNPRQAKRSTRYPAKPADQSKRPKPRKPLTLVMLPMPAQGNSLS
jgi:hypothetical protein